MGIEQRRQRLAERAGRQRARRVTERVQPLAQRVHIFTGQRAHRHQEGHGEPFDIRRRLIAGELDEIEAATRHRRGDQRGLGIDEQAAE